MSQKLEYGSVINRRIPNFYLLVNFVLLMFNPITDTYRGLMFPCPVIVLPRKQHGKFVLHVAF